jgi:hypothetical protein
VIPPAAAPASNVTAAPSNYPGAAGQTGPKKETARISILPEPVRRPAPTVKMTKTQPLMTAPAAKIQSAPVVTAPAQTTLETPPAASMLDAVPLPICWSIFGISLITLLIQIWNYFGS